MKRFLITLVLSLVVVYAGAVNDENSIENIDITVKLLDDGSALVSEKWEIKQYTGTEFYLVKGNLGDIQIENFRVRDLAARLNSTNAKSAPIIAKKYINIGHWDVDASFEDKSYKCGIVDVSDDKKELCWGLSHYGKHIYVVDYKLTNLVKSLDDYDMIHYQFVSPGLSSSPKHIKLTIEANVPLDTTTSKAWGFGYKGDVRYEKDSTQIKHSKSAKIVFESAEELAQNHSLIALVRFDKGLFASKSIREGSFEDVLTRAMDDAEDDFWLVLLISLAVIAGFAIIIVLCVKTGQKQLLGVSASQVPWCRDIPFGGDIIVSYYANSSLSGVASDNLLSALMLKMLYDGYLNANPISKDSIEYSFTEKVPEKDSQFFFLYEMIRSASGDDLILQKGEFDKWISKNTKKYAEWVSSNVEHCNEVLQKNGWGIYNTNWATFKLTETGKQEARKLYGLKKYLKDFRNIENAGLQTDYKEYMVYACIFGYATKLLKHLQVTNSPIIKYISPGGEDPTISNVLLLLCIMNHNNHMSMTASISGGSNSSSIGGGGGFSGGGYGGGAR